MIMRRSRHSDRTVRIQRSAYAFAFGARQGVRTILMSSALKTSSKGGPKRLSRS